PTLPVSLPPGSGPPDLRGGPARQEGAEEAGARGAADRARPRRSGRPRGPGHPSLLLGRAQRSYRRRAPAARGRRAETPRPVGGHPRFDCRRGGKKGLPPELSRLRTLLERGLTTTAPWWPAIR